MASSCDINISNDESLNSIAALLEEKTRSERDNCTVNAEDFEKLAGLKVPIPNCELDRIKVLRESNIFDTSAEEKYDRHVALACRIFKVSKTYK
jgi:hypothetical protein